MENCKPIHSNNTVKVQVASILVVDDSELFRSRLVSLLDESALNAEILQASDSTTTYQLFDYKNPMIVILDIHLPGDNGIKVLEYIKKRNVSTTVIMITSYATEQYGKKCLSLGADAFLEKNDDMEKIINLCRKALNNKRSEV